MTARRCYHQAVFSLGRRTGLIAVVVFAIKGLLWLLVPLFLAMSACWD